MQKKAALDSGFFFQARDAPPWTGGSAARLHAFSAKHEEA
jgi:hypothetical protein